jgi:hypothetical protein
MQIARNFIEVNKKLQYYTIDFFNNKAVNNSYNHASTYRNTVLFYVFKIYPSCDTVTLKPTRVDGGKVGGCVLI